MLQTSILAKGDHDFCVIDAAGGTSLTVRADNVPPNLEVTFRLLDRNLNVVKDEPARRRPAGRRR